jgi:regulatory protein YycI of two-component signal transduction system YycFG
MLNFRLKNLFIVVFLLISLTLTYGCSSKPSEETMKGIIMKIEAPSAKSSNFEEFKIIKEFNTKINDEKFHCMQVNYKIKKVNTLGNQQIELTVKGNKECFKFVKHGEEWSGSKGCKN